jgi:hypothetical protein
MGDCVCPETPGGTFDSNGLSGSERELIACNR